MTALSDALVAAQRRALTALEKAYVAGGTDDEGFAAACERIGATDVVDRDRLIASLSVIRDLGASLPAEATNGPERPREEATAAQMSYLAKLWEQKNVAEPLPTGLSKDEASAMIERLK